MGIPARSFIDSHPEEISKMKLLLMGYMKTLHNKSQVLVGGGTGTNPEPQKVVLTTTSDGYPILPDPWRNGDDSKKRLEELFSLYIGRHYSKCRFSADRDRHELTTLLRTGDKWSHSTSPIHSNNGKSPSLYQSRISPSIVHCQTSPKYDQNTVRRFL